MYIDKNTRRQMGHIGKIGTHVGVARIYAGIDETHAGKWDT